MLYIGESIITKSLLESKKNNTFVICILMLDTLSCKQNWVTQIEPQSEAELGPSPPGPRPPPPNISGRNFIQTPRGSDLNRTEPVDQKQGSNSESPNKMRTVSRFYNNRFLLLQVQLDQSEPRDVFHEGLTCSSLTRLHGFMLSRVSTCLQNQPQTV